MYAFPKNYFLPAFCSIFICEEDSVFINEYAWKIATLTYDKTMKFLVPLIFNTYFFP